MAKFLHIADIHLGIKRYNLPDRTTDFFRAWKEVLEKYAIERRVDFVLIAGDLFDQKKVDPQAANHAMLMLRRLDQERIPAVVIEGNHDAHEAVSRFSWLRSFSQWRYVRLLEPNWAEGAEGRLKLDAWDETRATGSFVDIADARIFGSNWYGTTISNALPLLAEGLRENRRPDATNILMLHSDIEGQLNRPLPSALPLAKLGDIRQSVDYLALGHTHKRFEIDNWAFNPGSLEACNVEETGETRGAYYVESSGSEIKAEFIEAGRHFFQRPFRRVEKEVMGEEEPDAVRSEVLEMIAAECARFKEQDEDSRPIIEVTLKGRIGFKNSLLRLDKLKEQAMEEFKPLGLMINNKTVPYQLAVATAIAQDAPRSEREFRVIADMIKQDPRFGSRADEIAAVVVEIKRLALEAEAPEKMFKLIESRLGGAAAAPEGTAAGIGATPRPQAPPANPPSDSDTVQDSLFS